MKINIKPTDTFRPVNITIEDKYELKIFTQALEELAVHCDGQCSGVSSAASRAREFIRALQRSQTADASTTFDAKVFTDKERGNYE